MPITSETSTLSCDFAAEPNSSLKRLFSSIRLAIFSRSVSRERSRDSKSRIRSLRYFLVEKKLLIRWKALFGRFAE